MFTRTPDRPPKRTAEPTAGAAPFIRSQPGALPPPAKPLELPGPPAAPEPPAEVPWEVEAMTSPDYQAPRSIHDPEHDSWPVAAPDGDAVPAWQEDETEVELELTELADAKSGPLELTDMVVDTPDEPVETPLELELDDVIDTAAAPPGGRATETPAAGAESTAEDVASGAGEVPYLETERDAAATFPLDAFIVPSGVEHVPTGYLEEIGAVVADRLEALARQIRTEGIASVGQSENADELAHVLGAIVTGYLARRA